MTEEDKMIAALESRLAVVERDIQHIKANSDERLEAIMARFDKLDRRANWWVTGLFSAALAVGGIYLEHILNKEDSVYPAPRVTHSDPV